MALTPPPLIIFYQLALLYRLIMLMITKWAAIWLRDILQAEQTKLRFSDLP
jgi:hypothetical protein